MAEDPPNAYYQSMTIAEAATASWYAHRSSTPSSNQSPSVHNSTQGRASTAMAPPAPTPTPAPTSVPAPSEPAPEPAPEPASESVSASPSASTASSSPDPTVAQALPPGASVEASTPTPTSSRRDSEVPAHEEVRVGSDISAWQSALQALTPEFAGSALPTHPLAQALADQPTLRPIEWNQYRQQGGFVPRTAHDYSSLMIYISGQVNPNPCRNCLLRNGPFARCVVSPPSVLSVSALRHACANCTYQNQYKRCTNEPISEQDKARIMAKPKATMPMKPMINAPTKRRDGGRELELEQEAQERLQQKHQRKQQRLLKRQQKLYKRQRQQQQQEQRLHEQGDRAMGQTLASRGLGIGNGLELFDEKLRHIRSCSPRSRRRMAAQVLQWQAAIATVEAEDSALDASVPASFHTPVPNNANGSRAATTTVEAEDIRPTPLATPAHSEPAYNQFRVPFYRFAAPQTAPTSSATFTRHSPTERSSANHVIANYGAGNTPEPMEEDESESEHEDSYEGTPYAGTNGTGPVVKAPR